MSNVRISIIVDHPLRDLPGVSLIAAALAEKNFDVYLVPMFVQERECLALTPQFVLLNYLRGNNENFARRLKRCGIQFGINDTEGGFFGDISFYGNLLSKDAELFQYMNCNLVWGRKIQSYLQKEFPVKHNVILTGLPRFDFYSEKYRSLKLNLIPPGLRENLVLINTKVAVANPQFHSIKKEIDLYKNKLGISDDLINYYLTYGKFAIDDNIDLCKKLSAVPGNNVVLRPHPHENSATYSRELPTHQYPNVNVIREGPVTPWILASKAVIHRHCTTAIEAALCGKPAISPSWVRTSANAPDAESVSHLATNFSDLLQLLSAAKADSLSPTPQIQSSLERIIDEWLYVIDGNAHQRVAAAIVENLRSNIQPDRTEARKQMFKIYDHRADAAGKLFNAINRLGHGFSRPLWQLEMLRLKKWKTSSKNFTPQDVASWIDPVLQAERKAVLAVDWAPQEDYIDGYPGFAVKVTRKDSV